MARTTRSIIHIDSDKCNGCGICVDSCAEGAIQLVDGKAKLVSESYCDGLGACLAPCPTGAIAIEERVAEEFDEAAAMRHVAALKDKQGKGTEQAPQPNHEKLLCGCPGSMARTLKPDHHPSHACENDGCCTSKNDAVSALANWPVQLKLVPVTAPYLAGADILLCADCVPFAVPGFHDTMLRGKVALVACPKLDDTSGYEDKLADIIRTASPKSLTVARMEVPCCGGLVNIAQNAVTKSGKQLPVRVLVAEVDGKVRW